MNYKYLIALAALFTALNLFGQKDTAMVGLYITNLYDFNIGDGCYTAEFWTWTIYQNDSLNFEETQEVTHSKRTNFSNYNLEQIEDGNWMQKKCTSIILQDWDVRLFPFDRQVLTINLEEALHDTTVLAYTADIENSKISDSLALDEWIIDSFRVKSNSIRYNTTYGDPTLSGESVYPSVTANIFLTRSHSKVTFIKLVTGVYVAFLIALLVFLIQPHDTDTRIGLAVGGLFAAVGNKYIVESVVPTTTQTTLVDLIHISTFGAILFIVIMVIVISRNYHFGREARAHRLEMISFWATLFVFIAINLYLVADLI
ncbi:MAG: hypothetical protein IT258_05290 [Saprospiraceae bacterium]|nr:hypothetical protein [Saprospiraceae bacterium]